ncbi:DUF1566 domain-containing protein [Stappia sp. BW2]|uniref:Lcl C-terminal domain-containing protein n=1 Tax=Stappia sp. BW2 TaxID=2592622 RepID=UPI0011DEA8D6|nr:DUF1566 domain-containing protein [Stappia sp. BW2]TYC67219.1 DUF1566 domain-containing protein [Stappia sp. BW2]
MKFSTIFTLIFSLFLPITARATCIETTGSGFILKGPEATDGARGLTWKRCAIGMSWDAEANTCSGEPRGLTLDEALAYAEREGGGWRVPTGPELETLYAETCEGPKIDTVAFPNITASDFGEGATFWTSTEAMPGMFYFFDVTNGYFDMHSKGYHLSVLLVKGRLLGPAAN